MANLLKKQVVTKPSATYLQVTFIDFQADMSAKIFTVRAAGIPVFPISNGMPTPNGFVSRTQIPLFIPIGKSSE